MAGSKSVTVSRVIPAPADQIWRVLDDTSRYAEWVPQTLEVTRNDGEAVVGATYDERNSVFGPIKGDSRWRVVERDPGRHSLHEGEGLPLVSDISIEFRTAPAGESTEVTTTLRYDTTLGPVGALIDKLAHGQTVAAQEEALANLEQVVLSDSRQTAAAATPR
jgi:carbon monoxide dehydrogenase subunit G